MPRFVFSARFKKSARDFLKRHPELRKIFEERLELLRQNPKDSKLRVHKLSGKLSEYFAVRITFEYRVIFYFSEGAIYLLAIGSHDEVY